VRKCRGAGAGINGVSDFIINIDNDIIPPWLILPHFFIL
jgi:hypothetical protein